MSLGCGGGTEGRAGSPEPTRRFEPRRDTTFQKTPQNIGLTAFQHSLANIRQTPVTAYLNFSFHPGKHETVIKCFI